MVMAAAFVSLKKLTGAAIVKTAARHNLREIQAELGSDSHINPAQTCRNMHLAGPATAAEVADLANNAMQDAGADKLRKDAVRAVEVLVSMPATFDPAKLESIFADALEWVRGFFGVPVLSAVVHLDEEAPHMHALLLPLANGRMVGSDLVGNRGRLQAIQAGFFESVACRYGLSRPRQEKRLSRVIRDEAASVALACLFSHPERLQQPSVRTALHEAIATHPEPMLAALGLEMPTGNAKAQKSFVEIMTKPCKPEPKSNPVGFKAPAVTPESKPYPCVGFA
ncbi:plasmid recombination protein [Uliginosibacterium sp. TH139]|uniref:plasmid recombination protein n=1 Tax=Uliginosibacterium sp. TH139 TaxID=2067453 RepID=UPI0013042F21|nr:plasmid recombination protein [Uliginosibacterium sp. TH139]